MAAAIGLPLIVDRVRIAAQSLKRPALAGERRQAVQIFDRLLALHAGDDRADRGRRRRAAAFHFALGEQVARAAMLQDLPVALRHGAFVASAVR